MKIAITIFALVNLFFISGPALAAGSASLSFSPSSGNYQVGQNFNVIIYVNPAGETVDMVRAKVTFPAGLLEIQNFSLSTTYNFPAGGNNFDNSAGILSYGAGVAGGNSSPGTFGTIVFRAKAAGQARVVLNSDSLVLAGGEDKFDGQASFATFNINAGSVTPVPGQPPAPNPKPQQLKEPGKEATSTEETITEEGNTEEGEIMMLGENSDPKKPSGFNKRNIIIISGAVILAIIGGIISKLKKSKTTQE